MLSLSGKLITLLVLLVLSLNDMGEEIKLVESWVFLLKGCMSVY